MHFLFFKLIRILDATAIMVPDNEVGAAFGL
jgi:hypothetical protein